VFSAFFENFNFFFAKKSRKLNFWYRHKTVSKSKDGKDAFCITVLVQKKPRLK
jgi:hypothetical protein